MAKRRKAKTLLQKRPKLKPAPRHIGPAVPKKGRAAKRVKHLSPEHRKAIAKGLKRWWKRQREESEVPRGFKTSRQEIEPMLNRVMAEMMREFGVDGDIRREINADMSVDWELRFSIHKGLDLDAFTNELGFRLRPQDNAWIGTGVRFPPGAMSVKDRAEYDRFKDSLQVHAHYQRMTKKKIGTNVLAIQKIMDHMRKNRRRKANQVFVRVHWNLKGERPE